MSVVEVERRGRAGWLIINRPDVRNALNDEVSAQLGAGLDAFEADPEVRVVVLAGKGSAFSAGADLNFMKKMKAADRQANQRDALGLGSLFHRISSLAKPVVACVNGPALGGGAGLVAAADIVVAEEGAFFAFSEVRLGLVPAVISPFCLRRLGPALTRRLFLSAERFNATQAKAWGFVDEVASGQEALDAAVDAVVGGLCRGGPQALAEVKTLLDRVVVLDGEEVLEFTAQVIARLRVSEEAEAGMSAFLDKKPAPWVEEK